MVLQDISDLTLKRWLAIATPDERIFILYIVSAVALAFASFLFYRLVTPQEKPEKIDKGFWAYLLDKDVFLHKSARQDYIYFFVNGLIYVGIISQLLLSTHFFMVLFYAGLQNMFGIAETAIMPVELWTIALYTLVYALFLDFAIFITHYAQHKIPILWQFHKVHHSAEVLTPITLYRMHPVDLFVAGVVASLLAGLAFAGYYYLTAETPQAYEIMGVNILVFLFYLLGYNLRHSHIWLNYPGWLSHIFISPAQHQIHHSVAPKHFDKNLGLIFAFWDKLFGTLYVPRTYEKLEYGINKKKPNPFDSVWDLYMQPFRNAWKIVKPNERYTERALVFMLMLAFIGINYAAFWGLDRKAIANSFTLPSVHIEELTWTEVRRALDREDIDTIIIPTGGTEQNGPHVVLGKHNYVIRHTAGEIAARLGHAVVAPVMAYVPEEPHMGWAGTVSVPEDVFEAVLEAAAQSYKTHGFRNILFIGDSAGNQNPQIRVAEKLTAAWQDDNVRVFHIGDYYSANNQIGWLEGQGYTREQIGGHAGIRDTSEMLFIHPDGFRENPVTIDGQSTGYNGEPDKASAAIGEQMAELKIQAALSQIETLLGDRAAQREKREELSGVPYR